MESEQYTSAQNILELLLSQQKKIHGESHPSVANILKKMADVSVSLGSLEKSEPLYIQALAMFKKFYGEKFNINLTSHSFRIGYVTTALRHTSLHQTQLLIDHN